MKSLDQFSLDERLSLFMALGAEREATCSELSWCLNSQLRLTPEEWEVVTDARRLALKESRSDVIKLGKQFLAALTVAGDLSAYARVWESVDKGNNYAAPKNRLSVAYLVLHSKELNRVFGYIRDMYLVDGKVSYQGEPRYFKVSCGSRTKSWFTFSVNGVHFSSRYAQPVAKSWEA